eukprot:TRINITY_DN36248_c0_g1_i1.p1 TRINITY_DN36248_c0_g1~~TRINITY_DN36248_c0_g1_i1.p1  ORF type:complete len:606 (-),score=159.38 TRINITY_DN36248_c0_g1_i1:59-1876(-)
MRAGAAAALKKLQAARTERPRDPCILLVGDASARHQVRIALGASSRESQDANSVAGWALHGLCLVEPPDLLGVTEATELATFLRGLQDAHGAILCASREAEASKCPVASLLPLLASFYGLGAKELRSFLTVAYVGCVPGGEDLLRETLARFQLADLLHLGQPGWPLPESLHLDADSEAPARLLSRLQGQPAITCEPLQASGPLMTQYRAIQQQIGRRTLPSRPGAPVRPGVPAHEEVLGMQADTRTPSHSSSLSSPEKAQEPRKAANLEGRTWTVMVFGKTGAGKSHLANLLVGWKAFQSGDSLASVTKEDSVRKALSSNGQVTVLDTIGFGDTRLPPETVIRSLRDTANEVPWGVDALLFVMKKERVTAAEQETLAYVTQLLFGPECLPNLYMVVTHAGRLARESELREPWLKEQAAASPHFAAMLAFLGARPADRLVFVENADPAEAEDEDERATAEKRRRRALEDIYGLLARHTAPPYRHSIMHRAGQLQAAHLESLRQELHQRVEDEVRRELDKDRGALEQERQQLREEVEGQRQELKEQEEELRERFEQEWERMRLEFEERAKVMAREDLEDAAKEIVEQTEEKVVEQTGEKKGRRCSIM